MQHESFFFSLWTRWVFKHPPSQGQKIVKVENQGAQLVTLVLPLLCFLSLPTNMVSPSFGPCLWVFECPWWLGAVTSTWLTSLQGNSSLSPHLTHCRQYWLTIASCAHVVLQRKKKKKKAAASWLACLFHWLQYSSLHRHFFLHSDSSFFFFCLCW